MIALAVLFAASATAWSTSPAVGTLKCSSSMAGSPTMTLGYDRLASEIVIRESMVERRIAATFNDGGFSAVFTSPPGAKVAYLFRYHGNTGVLNAISFSPSETELAELAEIGSTAAGQARLVAKLGDRPMADVRDLMMLTCTNPGN